MLVGGLVGSAYHYIVGDHTNKCVLILLLPTTFSTLPYLTLPYLTLPYVVGTGGIEVKQPSLLALSR